MAKRVVEGLKWAREVAKPSGIPIGRPRGTKAFGIRYEKAVGAELPTFVRGQWFEFEDANGRGFCQTDFIRVQRDRVVVLELKHTWVEEGQEELEGLYLPVVQAAFDRKAVGIVVCRRLVPNMPNVIISGGLDEAIRLAEGNGKATVWHCLGSAVRSSQRRKPTKREIIDLAAFPF
jgi:hypothetical protein